MTRVCDSAESCPPPVSRLFTAGECDLRWRSCIIYAMRNVTCAVAEKCASGLTSYPRRSVRGICVAPTRVWRVQSRAQRGAALALAFRVRIVCQSPVPAGLRRRACIQCGSVRHCVYREAFRRGEKPVVCVSCACPTCSRVASVAGRRKAFESAPVSPFRVCDSRVIPFRVSVCVRHTERVWPAIMRAFAPRSVCASWLRTRETFTS